MPPFVLFVLVTDGVQIHAARVGFYYARCEIRQGIILCMTANECAIRVGLLRLNSERTEPEMRDLAENHYSARDVSCDRPHLGQDFRLLQHRLRCLFLFVWRIAVLAQDALYNYAQLGANTFANCPINRDVLFHCFH